MDQELVGILDSLVTLLQDFLAYFILLLIAIIICYLPLLLAWGKGKLMHSAVTFQALIAS